MSNLNRIVDNKYFQATALYEEVRKRLVGFVDVGAAGGVHSLILPIASVANCLCFEPNETAFEGVRYETKESCFSNLIVYNTAIYDTDDHSEFYITKSEVNSSLLKADAEFINRYSVSGFNIVKNRTVKVQTLDNVAQELGKVYPNPAEIIKLDCQGTEYDILKGASDLLEGQCVAVWCEVEFFQVYENQKLFSDIDQLLREKGFCLYGLYPNYVSAKQLDRTRYEPEERLMWADALYLKDPLSPINTQISFPQRSIDVLIISSLLLNFFDLSLELIHAYIRNEKDRLNLIRLVEYLAFAERKVIEKNVEKFMLKCTNKKITRFFTQRNLLIITEATTI